MDGNRFDLLTRMLTDVRSRRSMLRGLVGAGGLVFASRAGNVVAERADRVTICHKPGTQAQQTLAVAASAVKAHLGHGDVLGQCHACTIEDEMVCEGTGFTVCQNGNWVYRDCAQGTECRPDATSGIICDWPT